MTGPDLNVCSPLKAEVEQTTLVTTLLVLHGVEKDIKGKKCLLHFSSYYTLPDYKSNTDTG